MYEFGRMHRQPRHRFIACLDIYGTERHFKSGEAITYWTDGFWDKACQELVALQLPPDQRQRVEQKLAERVLPYR